MDGLTYMKIALVHDWLNSLGGAERVLIELHKIFPDAPIYTLFYDKKFKAEHLLNAEVRPSFLQKLPLITNYYKFLAFLMPSAVESFDLSDFEVVISSSAFFSKGLILRPKTKHICYCYSPTRQLWDLNSIYPITDYGLRIKSNTQYVMRNPIIEIAKHTLRLWDRQAADRVDEFVAISETVRSRIQKYYKRDSIVIHPPISNFKFLLRQDFDGELSRTAQDGERGRTIISKQVSSSKHKIPNNYYLIVSRLYPHKNVDVAVEAFAKLNLPLVIIGNGPEYKNLKSQISNLKSIQLLGFVPDEELPYYYQNCRAFIMPQEEDFGLTPLEAMSFGKPVLALRKGGALETLREGVTGEFFDDPIPEALADGVRRLNENYKNYRPEPIQNQAKQFSVEKFRKEIENLVKF
ncbi:MAG: glycosyltransferase [Candidatus Yanofskybacteria bacterium]|nr:glycosyltransferase [Candidatus Yanofskybacteria bacterium]